MANEASDLPQKIIDTALGPKQVSVDGTTVTAQDLDKIIQAKRHLAGEDAADLNAFGLRFVKLEPPGAG